MKLCLPLLICVGACQPGDKGAARDSVDVADDSAEDSATDDSADDSAEDSAPPPDPPEAHAMAPGRYAAAWQWVRAGEHCNRLSELELAADGTVSDIGWTLCRDTWGGYVDVWPIGTPADGVTASDSDYAVQGVAAVLATEPETRAATWSWVVYGSSIQISWPDGTEQRWRSTWHEDELYKLEPYYVGESDDPTDTWLVEGQAGFSRNDTPTTGGWAFGDGDAPAFDTPLVSGISDLMRSYYARFLRWNGYYTAPDDEEGVAADQLNLVPYFGLTDTGVARYVTGGDGMSIYCYLSPVAQGAGLHPRLVAYQTSHDFDFDGNIADGPGHTYTGLLIADGLGAARGLVFVDQSYDTGVFQVMIMSAMAYLDVADTEAQEGIE